MRQPTFRPLNPSTPKGVFTSLPDLIRLQHKAKGFSFLPRQPVHSLLSGKHASKLRGRGLDFDEIKNYVPGDDIRTMDWKATLRTGKPQVRVYTEERERPVYMVVDQRKSMFFGSRLMMKSVAAAEIAALGAWRVFHQGDRVGAVIFNDRTSVEIRPQRSRKNVMRVLGEVVRFNHALGKEDTRPPHPDMLNRVLQNVTRLAPHDALVCVVSDLMGSGPETRRLATQLAAHNDVIVCFVFDPLEHKLPSAGQLVFSEGEQQLEVDTSSQKFREKYRSRFEEQLERGRKVLLRREVPLVPVSAADDPVNQILALLSRARSPKRRKG